MKTNFAPYAALLCLALASQSAFSSVIIHGTRVIYPSEDKEVTVRLFNKAKTPALVQAWVDDGDAKSTPDKVRNIPFLISPPIFRMESDKGQTLRISFTGAKALPSDRESIYWLNVLDVPPQADSSKVNNSLQFAFRTRIKLFYRPAGLKTESADSHKSLVWKTKSIAGKKVLNVSNPSPYFVSFNGVAMKSGQNKKELNNFKGDMVAPFSSIDIPVDPKTGITSEVTYKVINDFGGFTEIDSKLN